MASKQDSNDCSHARNIHITSKKNIHITLTAVMDDIILFYLNALSNYTTNDSFLLFVDAKFQHEQIYTYIFVLTFLWCSKY